VSTNGFHIIVLIVEVLAVVNIDAAEHTARSVMGLHIASMVSKKLVVKIAMELLYVSTVELNICAKSVVVHRSVFITNQNSIVNNVMVPDIVFMVRLKYFAKNVMGLDIANMINVKQDVKNAMALLCARLKVVKLLKIKNTMDIVFAVSYIFIQTSPTPATIRQRSEPL
jgi:hypothetical protein